MMKIVFIFLISLNVYSATGPGECGVYDVFGQMEKSKKEPGEYQYIVHSGTVSEYKFDLAPEQEIKLIPYLDRSSKIRVTLSQKISDFQGTFASLEKVEDVVPDPAGLTNNKGFILIKKEKCK